MSADTVPCNYNLKKTTEAKIKEIGDKNHDLKPAKVVDWAVEDLFEKLYGIKDPQPIPIDEELARN